MSSPRSTRKTRVWHLAALLLGVLFVGFAVFRVATRTTLRNAIDAIHAAGEPVTMAELDAWYKTPAFGGNAADYITDALARLRIPEGEDQEQIPLFGQTELPARRQPLDQQTRDKIDKLLVDNAEPLDLLHQAASIARSRYPVDLSRGQSTLLPHVSEMSKAARLLALEAAVHADRSEAEASVESLVAACGLGRSLLCEPIPISQTVRYTCDSIATKALEHALNRLSLTENLLAELDRAVQTARDPNALSRSLVGQRCFDQELFRNPRSMGLRTTSGSSGEPSLLSIEVRRGIGLLDQEWSVFLDLMRDLIEAARLPVHERLAASHEVQARLAALSRFHAITRFLMPPAFGLFAADLTDQARLEIARTALAVERYRLATGRFPAGLADLVPTYFDAVPEDPFDGRPLHYRTSQAGYTLYSIGTDETDDGGKERLSGRAGRQQTSYDITFMVERP